MGSSGSPGLPAVAPTPRPAGFLELAASPCPVVPSRAAPSVQGFLPGVLLLLG